MDFGIKDKVAVVLAASSGLGFAAAEMLANEGCKLAICSRNKNKLKEAAKAIRARTKADIKAESVDLNKDNEIVSFIQKIQQDFGSIDILVTNAGGPPVKGFEETNNEEWQFWYQTTFLSVVRAIRQVIPQMKLQHWGRIINITSISVKSPVPNLTYSNALRMAVTGLAKSLANELGPFGITVNNVAPGYHLTDGLERIITKKVEGGMSRENVLEEWTSKIPIRRLGDPIDLAGIIAFLASEHAGYISGTTIQVDGGLYNGSL